MLLASISVSIIISALLCTGDTSLKADAFKKADFQDYSIGMLGETYEASKNALFLHRVNAITVVKSNELQEFDSSGWLTNTEKSSKRLLVDTERGFDHDSVAFALNDSKNEWSWICSRMKVLNASLAVEQIKIDQRCTSSISVRNELSTLSVSDCIINVVTETDLSPFDCAGGTIRMTNISFQRTFPKQAWPSLVSASSCAQPLTGSVHVLCCTFSSFCASIANPFIGDVDLSFASASFCSFRNISVQSNNKNFPQKHSLQESKMEGCMVADCVCPFYGVLISGSRGCGFGSSNTSFIRSKNTISHQNFTNEAQSFSEGEIKFEDCNFTECSAVHGGAIAVSESAKLTVDKCTFSECTDTFDGYYGYGGAIFSNGSDCSIENSLFNCCRGTGNFPIGGAFTHITNKFSIVIGCSFENSSAAYGGSVAWFIGGSGSIYNTVFKCSKAFKCFAGTVYLQFHKVDFVISNCFLLNGNSKRGAGGFDVSDNDNNKNVKIQFCLFENNTVQKSTHAADIYIGKGFSLTDNTVQILRSFTLSTAPRKVVQCSVFAEKCGDKGVAYDSYLPAPQPEIHISNSGRNVDTCGRTGSECQTVEYGVTRWNSYLGQNVLISSEEFKEDMIDIDWRNIVFVGTESNSSVIKCHEASSNGCLISIGNGSLNAKRISFVCVFNRSAIAVGSSGSVQLELCSFTKSTQSTQPLTKSLIRVDEGSLTMEFVNVSGFSFSQGCAIALSDCKSVSLSNTSFWDIESEQNGGCLNAVRSEGFEDGCDASISGCTFEHCVVSGDGNGGGALFLSLPNTFSTTISSCSFEECEAPFDSQEGYGGGIFLELGHSDASLTIETPSFSSEKPNKAKHGNDLFVQSPDLKESITNETLPFVYALGHSSFDDLCGFHGNDHEHAIPLILFLEEVGSTVHVGSEDGADTVVCGFSDYPCHSLNYCVERLDEENAKTVAVLASATIENEMMLHNLDLKSSNTSKAEITCIKSLQASTRKVMASTGDVSVELIHFLLPSSLDAEIETLISLNSESNLSLAKCALEMQVGELNQISYWLFQICGGTLNINDCQIDSGCLCQAPIAVSENGAAAPTVISLKVKNADIGDQPLICVIPSSTSKLLNDGATSDEVISLSQCSFEGITNGDANRAVLIASSISSHVECLHWNVTNAKGAESIEGGAMKVVVEAQGQFTMENATFTKCCAECETGGKGGGVYFDCSASNAFSFQQMAFDQCSAKHGKNMFFLSSDLNASITKQTLAFEVSETAGDKNLFVGNDSTKTNFDLCRFLIGYASQEIHLSKNSGWDVLRCGSAEEPCATMEYGQKHFRALDEPEQPNMSIFLVIDEARVNSEVDFSNVTVTSVDAKSRPALTFGAAISPQAGKEEERDSVLANTGTCTLINIEICFGDGSEWKQTKLISTAGSAFAAQSCSFTSSSEAAIPYCVVACLTGTCEMSFCSFQSIKCKNHILMASHESSIDLTNVSMSNMELMGKSIVAELAQGKLRGEPQILNEGDSPTVELKCCTLFSLRQSAPSEPSIISCCGSEPSRVLVRNTSIKSSGSSLSENGGCIAMKLSEGSLFHCNFCSISGCFCSATGRGGAMFLDCSSIASDGLLPFLLENTTFMENKAFRGRDVYVKCANVEAQIGAELFQLDFRPPFVRELAMWGCTAPDYADEQDLLLLVVVYQSETIFASSSADNASDTRQCGTMSEPCISLNVALHHIIPSVFSNLLIGKSAVVSGEASACDVWIKSLSAEGERGNIVLNSSIGSKRSNLFSCSSRVKIEFLKFMFGSAFSSSHSSLLSLTDGNLSISNTAFSQVDSSENSEYKLNCSIILVENGRLSIDGCTFDCLRLGSSCVESSTGLYFSLVDLNISDVNSGVLLDFRNLADLSMQQVLISSCTLEQSVLVLHNCKDSHLQKVQVKNAESKASLIVFCSDGSGGHSYIQCSHVELDDTRVSKESLVSAECEDANVEMNFLAICSAMLGEGCAVSVASNASTFRLKQSSYQNITRNSLGPCCFASSSSSSSSSLLVELENCTSQKCISSSEKGRIAALTDLTDVNLSSCAFDGAAGVQHFGINEDSFENLCRWNGSMIDLHNCSGLMKDSTLTNSENGGLSLTGGSVEIEKGEFMNNNPSIVNYGSARRNILCGDSGRLKVVSLKGGDGVKDNASLWILDEGCTLEGIARERASAFFIPRVESVTSEKSGEKVDIVFRGSVLLPCNLSFKTVAAIGDEEVVEKYLFDASGFISEKEIHGSVPVRTVEGVPSEAEVRVCINFGKADSPSVTDSFVLKNRSESKTNEYERIVEGGKEQKSFLLIIVIILSIILIFFIVLFVVVVVLLRKKLTETKKRVEKERLENEQTIGKVEKRNENNRGSIEMSDMPSTLLEGMTSQIPLLIENDEEDLPEPPLITDDILNENDLPDLESPIQLSENASVSLVPQSHSLNVILAKKPFREKEKNNIKTLHSVIHSVQGNFTLGTRAMDVIDGKEVVMAVAVLLEHLISVDDERVGMIARQLCPYSIFVEEGNENEIFVLTEELKDEKQKEEMKRWKAPEEGNEDEEMEKTVVFTLGLILHEMTTGEVPLSECDAEEAQEMMRDGVRPLTEGIEGEDLVELMEKMWADEPRDRPSLNEIIKLLEEIYQYGDG
ncbi:putative Protein tyrosine and serine/threonine kinase [Monocercomonoides exilis]|uniref:putative Protein tyrosine and serine/threonine kinase n=1 Tax=Monocercomonoides exilis TaxID=2049356 RepID=UPI003559E1B5|nr:putative Protein tyrosine and serine/threonine kinase [Monocercomonoides exilis]|eukprot:MONOS_13143.1-p1 / transcript=MONOS_13143.1 / gene=MONOS_13143 / organism=Monocercomonoides_exilis_PA203 / gene_product=unspecified product / transcript_product=unspecified product / location=Mono_scaffold00782:20968-28881(+) / protein_length=2637 / sequence_SO=supercontig / SO=protein_coding / is_pseudo=false